MNSALGVTLSGQGRMANCFRRKQIDAESLGKGFDLLHLHKKNCPSEDLIFRDTERLSLAKPTLLKSRLKSLSKKIAEMTVE